MAEDDIPVGVLARAVERALRAPSVHNTQPWRWRLRDGEIELHADRTRQLPGADPDGRDLVLSCGAVLHHLRVALAAAHLSAHVRRLPSPAERGHLATVRVVHGPPERGLAELDRFVEERRTDRRPFGTAPVSPGAIGRLVAAATGCAATLHPVTDPGALRLLHEVLDDAGARQRFAPGYASELMVWTHRWAAARDGVPDAARTSAPAGPDLRVFPRGTLGGAPPHSSDGSVLLVLTTIGDGVLDHLLAGEAASAVLLAATAQGLATTPLSQAQEVPAARARLAATVLHSPDHPQLVIRVGHPGPDPGRVERTPRRTLAEVLLR
ncbi:NAD(P)H nitroreductase [Pseudonocardia sp. KRD-184]|uniref:NAD(P)H nitroreductase n=1 Tax=Pseudonocardia oceani TaxID=2792013 RepID=A0ABS6UHG5_9PSEU|nr:NAD(P)H nitroreductase [Pseudonocardia oceani]MBW0089904.1 NAD(P)H nitroreductase [Pseudonocardia oceani]MBW0096965.1 NAD(P)H nitroreductase [Pseudonocardia oceani]MBW0109640.1 NAD(P)H nitroreductase [Pseudonocardia oceani]MBW0122504.1 NAD(P)H nitroreductase [Pseudonocardia oceani]MBW0131676.1 NAD(P)H nitroreductase [Pseudonocardia oceani]